MKGRRLVVALAGAGLLLTCLGASLWLVLPRGPAPDGPTAYRRLQLGMTPAQVEAAIGRPPGYHRTLDTETFVTPSSGPCGDFVQTTGLSAGSLPDAMGRPEPVTVERWTWDDYWVWVAFDERETVVGFYLLEVIDAHYPRKLPTTSLLERLRSWFRL